MDQELTLERSLRFGFANVWTKKVVLNSSQPHIAPEEARFFDGFVAILQDYQFRCGPLVIVLGSNPYQRCTRATNPKPTIESPLIYHVD